jgi:hypothetical protein
VKISESIEFIKTHESNNVVCGLPVVKYKFHFSGHQFNRFFIQMVLQVGNFVIDSAGSYDGFVICSFTGSGKQTGKKEIHGTLVSHEVSLVRFTFYPIYTR